MSILIKGMEMPRGDMKNIMILEDGRVFQFSGYGNPKPLGTAVSVPDQGGLVDLKTPFEAQYYDEMTEEWSEKTVTVEDVLYGCMASGMPPVIIPADQAEEGGG